MDEPASFSDGTGPSFECLLAEMVRMPEKEFKERLGDICYGLVLAFQEGKRRMNYGQALEAVQQGSRIARSGWNGKNMFVIFVPGSTIEKFNEGSAYQAHQTHLHLPLTIRPHLDMCNADGQMQPGWLASQSDMLATDWFIVD